LLPAIIGIKPSVAFGARAKSGNGMLKKMALADAAEAKLNASNWCDRAFN
jgi:hypothetical protein